MRCAAFPNEFFFSFALSPFFACRNMRSLFTTFHRQHLRIKPERKYIDIERFRQVSLMMLVGWMRLLHHSL